MKQFKPLLRIGDRTVTDRLTALYREQGIGVILVTGWQKEKLRSGIDSSDISIVENPDFATGMFSSIKAGLNQVKPGECRAVFIHPVDIPLVRPYTIRRLLEAAEKNPGRIIYPVCGEERGHPAVLPAGIIPSILDWQGEGGLKAVLDNRAELALEISVPDDFIRLDMDTYTDYQALLLRYRVYEVPSPSECRVIFNICNTAPDRRRHCYLVADAAGALAEALAAKGIRLDHALVRAAAVLHDIAKGQKDHAGLGGRILREMGFGRTGKTVAAHSDLPEGIAGSLIEDRIVFLADKFVAGEAPVTLEDRYGQALDRFGADSRIKANILERKGVALKVKEEFELVLGYPLERIIHSALM